MSWCVQCGCGDQIWKFRNFVRWTWMEQAQLCTTWKRLNVESWWLWGAKPAGYSLFDIYVSGVVSASCLSFLGIWRNFGFFFRCKPQKTKWAHILSDARHLGHFATCSPFITWCALQEIAGFWIMSSCLIMSHHVSSCHLEYLEPIRCKRLCWSACQKNAQRLKKVFTDSRWFQSLLMIGVHVKKRMFQASTAFLAAGQLFFEDHVYCLLLCTSTVYTVYRYIQIHPDIWYRYRSMSQYDTICRPLG